uniref:Thiamine-phosphate synthase ThiN domain-containing protein n=1 Tax=Fervidicoccus fontis TaxID=683846 RepID=A0A7J3ZK15_9CREN
MAKIGILSCISNPARCSEIDVRAAAAYGHLAVIIEPENLLPQLNSLSLTDVLKVSFTRELRLKEAELEEVIRSRARLVVGPGVPEEHMRVLGARAEATIEVSEGKIMLSWKEKGERKTMEHQTRREDLEAYANTISILTACFMAKGEDAGPALRKAIGAAWDAWRYCEMTEYGCVPLLEAQRLIGYYRWEVLESLSRAYRFLVDNSNLILELKLVPQVGMNIAMSLPSKLVRDTSDVAAFPGRIVEVSGTLKTASPPQFGASRHLARAIIAIQRYHPEIRATLNVPYSKELIDAAKRADMVVSYYDRREEPEEVKAREGATIPWGIEEALRKIGYKRPDIVYHLGDIGKEPMINIFGESALEVVEKLIRIARIAKIFKSFESPDVQNLLF